MNEEKFVKVTEHYGYYHRQLDGYDCKHYDIYRIFGCHSERPIIASIVNKKDAIHECKYLEKLNFSK